MLALKTLEIIDKYAASIRILYFDDENFLKYMPDLNLVLLNKYFCYTIK